MKRREFCGAGLAALAGTSLPYTRLLAATAGEVPAMGLDGKQLLLKPADIEDFRKRLRGALLLAGAEGYDSARLVWNRAFDRKPALIARCAAAADVTTAVGFARAQGLLTAVRGGGHSLSGQSVCDGGLVIDLSRMNGIRIDPLAKRARVEPGVLLAALDREAQAFGLAAPLGTVSDTGAAGLTLGGGFGRLCRKYGLACDNLVAADLVTADGRFVKASLTENPDLLWALRGGGGNFGVVTSFEYRLHAVGPTMFGGRVVYPFTQAREVLRGFSDFTAALPDEAFVFALLPPAPDHQRMVVFDGCYCGPVEAGERVLAPLRKLGNPVKDTLGPTRYVELQGSLDEGNPPGRYYIKGGYVRRMTPELGDAIVDYLEHSPADNTVVGIPQFGGAISRVKPTATAYWHREASHEVIAIGFWDDAAGAESTTQWVRGAFKAIEPFTDGYYVNHGGYDESERRIRANYGDNYPRLAALKKRYDPANLFRLNANIKPA
ncbi:MAG TPA: FAD-binding oxidoreductase [Steroidobacteraceae bacterium]|nr:FAD-binding oxidoreductase [Steroidobacteraceae bacterium]